MHMGRIDHRSAIDAGARIALRIIAILREHGLQHARLHEIVARTAREGRQTALGGFRVDEDIRPVAATVYRRATDLDEADRLALRHETGRLRQFHAAAPLHMRMRPPAGEILDAKAPGLAIGAVGNRQPLLRATRGVIRIIPVEALARGRAAQEIVAIVDAGGFLRIEMARPVAPVGQRQISVDADKIHRLAGPDSIERKVHVCAAVAHLRAIFGPVGSIADLHASTEDAAQFARQSRERACCRIAAGLVA